MERATRSVTVEDIGRRERLARWVNGLGYVRKWLVLGVIIGVVAGLGAVVFINALDWATKLLLGVLGGYTPPSPLGEGASLGSRHFSRPWAVPLVTTLGGLISGILVFRWAPEAAGHGTDSAISAVHHNPSGIRARVSVIKIIASAFTIGSGGSGGREGPTAQISAGFASVLARLLNLSPPDARTAVSIGIGSGIGSIFRTPLGGAILGGEILYRNDIESDALIPGLIASITGFTIFGAFEGYAPIFGYQSGFRFSHPLQLVYYALIGVAAGLVGMLYNASFYGLGERFSKLPLPRALRPALAGLLVGLLGLAFPEVLGTGYGWVQQAMGPRLLELSLWVVILLPVMKILATSLSIGSGGSGGIFGPGMVIGGFVGAAMWRVLEPIAPQVPHSPAPFVIVAMMACFGSIGHVPFAVMLMVAEMTGNLALLAPAMIAVGVASFLVGDRHIYRAQLHTRADAPGHRFRFGLTPLSAVPVANVMTAPRLVVRREESAEAARERLAELGLQGAPVVDERGVYVGTLRYDAVQGDDVKGKTAGELADRTAPVLTEDVTLDAAMQVLALREMTWLPVVDDHRRPTGVLTSLNLVAGYRQALHSTLNRLSRVGERAITIEERLRSDSPVVGRELRRVSLPSGTLVLTVQRDRRLLFAHPGTVLRAGDVLSILTRPEDAPSVTELLGSEPAETEEGDGMV